MWTIQKLLVVLDIPSSNLNHRLTCSWLTAGRTERFSCPMSVTLAHNRGESGEDESRAALVCDGSTNVEGSDTCFKTILHLAGVFTSFNLKY